MMKRVKHCRDNSLPGMVKHIMKFASFGVGGRSLNTYLRQLNLENAFSGEDLGIPRVDYLNHHFIDDVIFGFHIHGFWRLTNNFPHSTTCGGHPSTTYV